MHRACPCRESVHAGERFKRTSELWACAPVDLCTAPVRVACILNGDACAAQLPGVGIVVFGGLSAERGYLSDCALLKQVGTELARARESESPHLLCTVARILPHLPTFGNKSNFGLVAKCAWTSLNKWSKVPSLAAHAQRSLAITACTPLTLNASPKPSPQHQPLM
eukprot:2404915-Pleurochrysis_carterae.AAC.1